MSAIEAVKAKSRSLRGAIAEELRSDTPGFSRDVAQLLKFHGVIQYSDRDNRRHRRREGLGPQYEFALRVRPTGGRLSAAQLLEVIRIVRQMELDGPRITSRQGFQIGGLQKSQIGPVIRRLHAIGLSTFASGGDVNCNVMACPAPHRPTELSRQLQWIAERIAASFLPDQDAYEELWLTASDDADRIDSPQRPIPIDPIYGPSYLPHKFKIGLAFPEDNCVDVFAQDVGLLAVCEGERIIGMEMLVGGGLGMIPSAPRSFPALAQPFAFVPLPSLLETIFAVMSVFRDFGNRRRRSEGRLKYLIASWGLETFRERVERRLRRPLEKPRGVAVTGRREHLGWHCDGGGEWYLGIAVESGQLGGASGSSLVAALEEILTRVDVDVRFTPQQNLLLTGVPIDSRPFVESVLDHHGVACADSLSPLRRSIRACPALPRCRGAITEAQRIVPRLVADLERELARFGLENEPCHVCVAGCSFGCARSYLADIALVGRTVETRKGIEKFAIYIGGDRLGRRLGRLYRDFVPLPEIIPTLRPLLQRYRREALPGETLGDFLERFAAPGDAGPIGLDARRVAAPSSPTAFKENQI